MTHVVSWSADSLSDLATIWIQASDRTAVTTAQSRIDALLSTNPRQHADARSEGIFSLDVPPLRAIFEMDDAVGEVDIVAIALLPD
jgi:hypothetical protein